MTFGSLFSGIGGLDLGLEWAGMRCVWQCEIDVFCRKVLAKHWPSITCYDDVMKINKSVDSIDLLCGGFPCQPHSVAGKRKGKDDERNLWPECIRLVRLLRPRWCLFENVPGLLTTMFGQVCDELRGASYEIWTLVLGADDVGAPHRRKRIWIVAKSNSRGSRGETGNAKHKRRGASKGGRTSIQASAERRAGAAIGDAGTADTDELGNTEHNGLATTEKRRGDRTRNDCSKTGKDQARQPSGSIDEKLADTRKQESGRLAQSEGRNTDSEVRESGSRGLAIQADAAIRGDRREITNRDFPRSRWPSRPGEPQHDWEYPRLISNPNTRPGHGKRHQRNEGDQRSDGNAGAEIELCGASESGVGQSAHGLSRRLARLRREQLKALGNSVVPQVAELIGRAIMYADKNATFPGTMT